MIDEMEMKYFAQQGFTLVEITMVLFILGLLMASFLDPLATRVEQEERNNTQLQLDEIEEILYGHVLQNNYLPCPDCSDTTTGTCGTVNTNDPTDINNGEEDILANTCATVVGNLPWATLGVKGTDEWDNEFTYRVDSSFADRSVPATDGTGCETGSATLGVSFSLCSDGDIVAWNMEDNTDPDFEIVATGIPAIVISEGKNWAISTSADETENTNGDVTFVEKDYSATAGAEFDDLMIWISPHVLRTMTVKAGILP